MGSLAQDVKKVGTLSAIGDTLVLHQPATAVVTFQLGGSFTGRVVFEVDNSEGASPEWVTVKATNHATGATITSATAAGAYRVDVAGFVKFQARCTELSSGTINVYANASVAPGGGGGSGTIDTSAWGDVTDAAVDTDTTGTISGKLRGLVKLFSGVISLVNGWLRVSVQGDVEVVNGSVSPLSTDGTATVTNFPATYPVTDNGGSLTVDDGGGSLTVDGSVSVSNLPSVQPVSDNGGSLTVDDGGLTLSVDDGGGSLTVDGSVSVSNLPSVQPVSDNSGSLTVDDGGGSLTVDGSVSVSNFPATYPVTDNSGSLTVDDGGGSLTVDGPLTDTQLRATPVPVSGTVTITDGSGPVTVDGTVTVSGTVAVSSTPLPDDRTATGSFNASAQSLDLDVRGCSTAIIDITGTFTGTLNFSLWGDNGANSAAGAYFYDTATGTLANSTTGTDSIWQGEVGGFLALRITASGWSSGTATVKLRGSIGTADVFTGRPTDTEAASNGSVIALLKRLRTLLGTLTETAPATDIASSGLNGRLQRIAQRVTSLIALLPTALTGSGNLKVAVQEALPAGTSNIGCVDVVSVIPLTGATNLGKAEDDAHSSGDVGVMAMGVRRDAACSTTSADGDYTPLALDELGRLRIFDWDVRNELRNHTALLLDILTVLKGR